jgi:hypothetical protein
MHQLCCVSSASVLCLRQPSPLGFLAAPVGCDACSNLLVSFGGHACSNFRGHACSNLLVSFGGHACSNCRGHACSNLLVSSGGHVAGLQEMTRGWERVAGRASLVLCCYTPSVHAFIIKCKCVLSIAAVANVMSSKP